MEKVEKKTRKRSFNLVDESSEHIEQLNQLRKKVREDHDQHSRSEEPRSGEEKPLEKLEIPKDFDNLPDHFEEHRDYRIIISQPSPAVSSSEAEPAHH